MALGPIQMWAGARHSGQKLHPSKSRRRRVFSVMFLIACAWRPNQMCAGAERWGQRQHPFDKGEGEGESSSLTEWWLSSHQMSHQLKAKSHRFLLYERRDSRSWVPHLKVIASCFALASWQSSLKPSFVSRRSLLSSLKKIPQKSDASIIIRQLFSRNWSHKLPSTEIHYL